MKDEQIQYIIDNYQAKTDREIAKELSYHPSSIKQIRLGLRLIKKTRGIKNAVCHPNSRHVAFGLCKNCYDKRLKGTNPEYAQRQRVNCKEWSVLNKERIRDTSRKYTKVNREKIKKNGWLWRIEKQYGMSEEDYSKLMIAQSDACAICGKSTGLQTRCRPQSSNKQE